MAVVGAEAGLTVVTFHISTVWLGGSGGAGVMKMVGAAVTVCVGTVVAAFLFAKWVTSGSVTVNVAAIGGTGVGNAVVSSKSGDACSHFTLKCKTRVDHEVMIDGARFSYQASASKPDWQFR